VRAMASAVPGLDAERTCWEAGAATVVGIDEVGRGAWAGPVTVGALVIPQDRRIYKVRDSKMLTSARREALYDRIAAWAPAFAVGHAWPHECDELGMTAAQRLAARRALDDLSARGHHADAILLDGKHDYLGGPGDAGPRVETIVKGDASSLAIAAASVMAKVTRDRLMVEDAPHYPAYGFDSNVGYPAPVHQYALHAYGPTPIHRKSWMFMDALPWFRRGPDQAALF